RGVDVDTGGVWVRHPESRPCARPASVLLIPRCHSGLHKGNRESTEAASAGEYPTKAVSQTGTRAGAPPMMSTQSPGTMFTIGYEAPLDVRNSDAFGLRSFPRLPARRPYAGAKLGGCYLGSRTVPAEVCVESCRGSLRQSPGSWPG